MKHLKCLLLALPCALLLLGCGQGGGSNAGADRVAAGLTDFSSAPEIENAYTVIVALPVVTKTTTTTIYDSLYGNLTNATAQAKVPISRVLLTTVSPSISDVFNVDNAQGSLTVSFLSKLADYNNKNPSLAIQVIAYPDVEPGSPWLGWVVPTQYLSIPSCKLSQTAVDQSQQAMLLSICWASAVNKFIGSKIISGVAYDQQKNWLVHTNPLTQIPWTYDQAHADGLLIGWISGKGIAAAAGKLDLNFVEVYDLYSQKSPFYDSIALETISGLVGAATSCSNGLCSYDASNIGSNVNFFPGTQYDYPYIDKNGNQAYAGAVGANIYECAISKDLNADSCTTYAQGVDTSQSPSAQIMQAFNYIWNGPPKQSSPLAHFGSSNYLGGNVIYLFSTQYIGPQKSYFATSTVTSRNQCADPSAPANSCSCIATLYSPNAFCGADNGFGAWGDHYPEFVNFTKLFLGTYGSSNCPGQSCSAGIFMYDYIPQAWYTK